MGKICTFKYFTFLGPFDAIMLEFKLQEGVSSPEGRTLPTWPVASGAWREGIESSSFERRLLYPPAIQLQYFKTDIQGFLCRLFIQIKTSWFIKKKAKANRPSLASKVNRTYYAHIYYTIRLYVSHSNMCISVSQEIPHKGRRCLE